MPERDLDVVEVVRFPVQIRVDPVEEQVFALGALTVLVVVLGSERKW
jgi:hypothetical protein